NSGDESLLSFFAGLAERELTFQAIICAYRDHLGTAREGETSVPFLPKANFSTHSLIMFCPFICAGANFHCCAASCASRAKYSLGPWEMNVTSVTFPAGSTATLTETRTFPCTVLRARCEGSGITWRIIPEVKVDESGLDGTRSEGLGFGFGEERTGAGADTG